MKINKFYYYMNHKTQEAFGAWNDDPLVKYKYYLYSNDIKINNPHIIYEYDNDVLTYTNFKLDLYTKCDCKDEKEFERIVKLRGFV